jgi:D,D-heptose 1,7-bisphosphate phosphatase
MQAVFLVGGLGSRLGELTRQTPKPLLEVGGRPFLDYLIEDVARHGFTDMLFLAQFEADQVRAFCAESPTIARFGIRATVLEEPVKAGTGGALWHARDVLLDHFLLLNGDSWLQGNYCALPHVMDDTDSLCSVALREIEDTGRFGRVQLNGHKILAFAERGGVGEPGHINGGVYFMKKAVVERGGPVCSLEADILPEIAREGALAGIEFPGYFIDIGLPESFERAQTEFVDAWQRPALFLDRDGVLNVDHGHVGSVDRFEWIDGAIDTVRRANDMGWLVFVVTNQAGVAKGYYDEEAVQGLHRFMQAELLAHGAHIDEYRYCPYHLEGTIEAYRRVSEDRKPAPGMLLDLMERWPVTPERSLIIGDKASDIEAGEAAGIKGLLFSQGSVSLADAARDLI